MKKILIINGANLNMLGKREKEQYGNLSLDEINISLRKKYEGKADLFFFHSNIEGEIVNEINNSSKNFDAVIINAGGYTHTSVSIHDSIKASPTKFIEVHISNILNREEFRKNSIISKAVCGSIIGFKEKGYMIALDAVLNDNI